MGLTFKQPEIADDIKKEKQKIEEELDKGLSDYYRDNNTKLTDLLDRFNNESGDN